ncbi:MAG: ATP synthase F1 subunit delta [Proteobacteria bacterium]|nr:ATP synthase F1 subunit delta [Pseudomonadota bacterium]
MIAGRISQRYAQALLRIAIDHAQLDSLGDQLAQLTALLREQGDLRDTLENPTYGTDHRRKLIDQLANRLGLLPALRNCLRLLLDRGRIALLPEIARSYAAGADRHAGRVRAEVTSAAALAPELAERIKRALEQRTGQRVLLTTAVDPGLIAGLATRVGSLLFDDSLRARLTRLRQALLEERA